jgi:uncharacterized membrane protein YidH (DUF202 family)
LDGLAKQPVILTAGNEAMEENGTKPEDLHLGDKLAVQRTVLAADRTMLAGVRTSVSFIGFGFTIFNVLRYVLEHSLRILCEGGAVMHQLPAGRCRNIYVEPIG